MEDAKQFLDEDEALVFFLTGDQESYVFALTRSGFAWHSIGLGAEALSARVAAFRRGLDVETLSDALDSGGKPELFDLARAQEFDAALLGAVRELIKDKHPSDRGSDRGAYRLALRPAGH